MGGYISLVKEQEGYTLLSIEPILDGEYIDRNNGNVIFKPGRYMVKYKTAGGEEQEYKLLVENDPLLSIGVDGEKVGLDRRENIWKSRYGGGSKGYGSANGIYERRGKY